MSTHDFFSQDARRKVTEAIANAERQTSAEIVVALRRASSSYRAADLLFAALCAMATLLVMLFIPTEFPLWAFALDVALVFAAASWLARLFPTVERALTPAPELVRTVRDSAAAAFLGRGIHRCKGRNGLLLYVSVLERAVEVVADIGVDVASVEPSRKAAQAALVAGDVGAFVVAIEKLGDALSAAHPRGQDDVNELGDEVDA